MDMKKIIAEVSKGIGRSNSSKNKKSMLFSFTPRAGEEFPSDSEDSDYSPGRKSTDEDDNASDVEQRFKNYRQALKRKKNSRMKMPQTKKSRPCRAKVVPLSYKSTSSEDSTSDAEEAKPSEKARPAPAKKFTQAKASKKTKGPQFELPDCDTYHLPPELWLNVFVMAVHLQGISNFVWRASRVCRQWWDLCKEPVIFQTLDLNVEQRVMTSQRVQSLLLQDLSQCRQLSLSGQHKLKQDDILMLLNACPSLSSVDLSNCSHVKYVSKELSKFSLRSLDLSMSKPTPTPTLTWPNLQTCITSCGLNLVELRLAGVECLGKFVPQLLIALQNNCPNIEELDIRQLQQNGRKIVDFNAFSAACPHLRELRLDKFNLFHKRDGQHESSKSKLSQLQYLSLRGVYGEPPQGLTPGDGIFYNMFDKAASLRELDISGSDLSPSLVSKDLVDVKTLYMSNMVWMNDADRHVFDVADIWGNNLQHLDISNNTKFCIDDFLWHLSNCSDSKLEVLNLSCSNVTDYGVMQVIKRCKRLKQIDLTSCRDMPRGTKQLHNKEQLKTLLKTLCKGSRGK